MKLGATCCNSWHDECVLIGVLDNGDICPHYIDLVRRGLTGIFECQYDARLMWHE